MKRVANYRKFDAKRVEKVVEEKTKSLYWGLFRPLSVNLLKLNLALDEL
jgi:K+-transporting ATPase c subunit